MHTVTGTDHARRALAVLCAAAVTLTATGCAPRTTSGPPTRPPVATVTPPATQPTGSVVPTGPPAPALTRLKIYLDANEKVQPVTRTVPETKAVLAASLKALLEGPTAAERRAGLDTLIPKGTRLRSVKLAKGIATVDLTGAFDDGGGTLSMTNRLAQVVYTLTQFSGVTGVRFRLDGRSVTVFGGEGLDLSDPQTRADYEYATPPVLIDEPAWGSTVTSPVTLRGTANVFEATLQLEVLDPNGVVKAARTITASSGTGTRGTWSATVPFSLGAPGTGRIRVFTLSAKDGSRQDVLEVPVAMTH